MKIKLLIIFLTVQSSFSIKSSNYCSIIKDKCYSIKNKTSIECTRSQCNKEYPYQCGVDFCSRDSQSCRDLHEMIKELKSLRMLKLKLTIDKLFTRTSQKYHLIVREIKNCQIEKYEWKPSDICLRGIKCRTLEALPIRYGGINLLTPIECPCASNFSHYCDNSHCAKDVAGCQGFLIMKSVSNQLNINKSCGNSYSVIRKNQNFN